jgi:hypothetical protein
MGELGKPVKGYPRGGGGYKVGFGANLEGNLLTELCRNAKSDGLNILRNLCAVFVMCCEGVDEPGNCRNFDGE